MPGRGTEPSLQRAPGRSDNWVEQAGKLPDYVTAVAKDLHYSRGMTISHAIATAISRIKVWARGGAGVHADTVAKAQVALAEWEALKAKSHAKSAAKNTSERKTAAILLATKLEAAGYSREEAVRRGVELSGRVVSTL